MNRIILNQKSTIFSNINQLTDEWLISLPHKLNHHQLHNHLKHHLWCNWTRNLSKNDNLKSTHKRHPDVPWQFHVGSQYQIKDKMLCTFPVHTNDKSSKVQIFSHDIDILVWVFNWQKITKGFVYHFLRRLYS